MAREGAPRSCTSPGPSLAPPAAPIPSRIACPLACWPPSRAPGLQGSRAPGLASHRIAAFRLVSSSPFTTHHSPLAPPIVSNTYHHAAMPPADASRHARRRARAAATGHGSPTMARRICFRSVAQLDRAAGSNSLRRPGDGAVTAASALTRTAHHSSARRVALAHPRAAHLPSATCQCAPPCGWLSPLWDSSPRLPPARRAWRPRRYRLCDR
ncbi:hypothetical protein BU26DRAFT_160001 [Trematosphaeria pertusa]|uniref:Uncharacterized protein n=1 Tax=Trematosphaeria pertusa TaxID=390896 RepID=A0A6A6HX83_9PLEO|nr:uncharacterized protein BU26DRAFT_160001 [Trematosphaeria pertusa]KAF2242378.1 hypothetical protein BU26DRAFT_160001 [Trematosphaeria pertusa]